MALTDNLISDWHMNNDWQDSFGANHGTPSGAVFSTDSKLGSHAGSFDNVDDKLVIANETTFDFERTQAFSLAAWIKTGNTGFHIIFSKFRMASPYWGYEFTVGDGGAITDKIVGFLVNDGGGNLYIKVRGNTIVTDSAYHLVVMTYNGNQAASGVKLYVDGTVETLTTMLDTLNGSILNDVALHLGGRENNTAPFGGLLDEGLVWNREITASEVTELWNSGNGMEIGANDLSTKIIIPSLEGIIRITGG